MSGLPTLTRSASGPRNPGPDDVLEALVKASVDGIVVVDAYRRFVFANPAACELLGRSREELIGRDFLMVIPERERQSAMAEFAKISRSTERRQGMVCRPDGTLLDIEFTTTLLESGGVELIAAILRDVSERRRQAKEAAAIAQAAASVAVCDSIDMTVRALADCAVKGTQALGASVILDDRTEAGFWIGAAGLPDGFREAMRVAGRARACMAALG